MEEEEKKRVEVEGKEERGGDRGKEGGEISRGRRGGDLSEMEGVEEKKKGVRRRRR